MASDSANSKHLWISGLRRSGTTAIWRMFRPLEGFTCYDEPFNPKMRTHLPEQHRKGTWDEFIALWNDDHANFTDKLAAIDLLQELEPGLDEHSTEYLSYLAQSPTVIDFTRLNFKMQSVMEAFPEAVALFIYRSPIAFATSHIINSENRKFMRQSYYRTMFFTTRIGFDSWGIESIVDARSFPAVVEQCGVEPRQSLEKMRSVEKLLLYWLATRRYAQAAIARARPGMAFEASYEDIIDGMSAGFDAALVEAGIAAGDLQRDHLRSYSLGHRPSDPVWTEAAQNAGFTDEEIELYLRRPTR